MRLNDKIYFLLNTWKKSVKIRIVTLFLALGLLAIGWTLQFYYSTEIWDRFPLILSSILQDYLMGAATMLIVFPMLLSKYKPLSYILTMRGFSLLSQFMLPISVLMPIMYVRYYYELHQMLTINFYQMIFYAIGTYIFCLPLSYIAYMLFMAPITALMNIFRESELINNGQKQLRFDFQFIDFTKLDMSMKTHKFKFQ